MGHLREVYQRIQGISDILDLVIVHVQLGQVHERLHDFWVQGLDVVLA